MYYYNFLIVWEGEMLHNRVALLLPGARWERYVSGSLGSCFPSIHTPFSCDLQPW